MKNVLIDTNIILDITLTREPFFHEAVQKALDVMQSKNLFSDVDDPVDYQKRMRDEWS